jgi:hypothetical protein
VRDVLPIIVNDEATSRKNGVTFAPFLTEVSHCCRSQYSLSFNLPVCLFYHATSYNWQTDPQVTGILPGLKLQGCFFLLQI